MMNLEDKKTLKKVTSYSIIDRGFSYKGIIKPYDLNYVENLLRFMDWNNPCEVVKKRLKDFGVTEASSSKLMKRIVL